MIVKEFFITRADGVDLFRTYSDENRYIRQIETGFVFEEAIDVETSAFTYEETDEIIPAPPDPVEPADPGEPEIE